MPIRRITNNPRSSGSGFAVPLAVETMWYGTCNISLFLPDLLLLSLDHWRRQFFGLSAMTYEKHDRPDAYGNYSPECRELIVIILPASEQSQRIWLYDHHSK